MAQIQGVLGYHMAPPGQMAHTAKWPKKGQKPVKMTQKQLFLTLFDHVLGPLFDPFCHMGQMGQKG